MTSTAPLAASAPPPTRSRTLTLELRDPMTLAVAALTAFTFVVRFSQIHQSLLGDEVWTYQDILGRTFVHVLTNVHTGGENSPPLFFLLAYATGKLGDLTVWIRLPSIIFGALLIPVLYLIGRETVGRAAGLLAGAVTALSPFSFYYGVEARPYATMAFFVALSTWAVLRAVKSGRRGWWALYVLADVCAAYTHYTAVFVLAAQGIWSLWVCRDRIAAPLIAGATAAILYLPWLPELRGKELNVIGALQPLTTGNVLTDLMRPIAGYPYAPLSAIPTWIGLGVIVACALAGAAFLARDLAARRERRQSYFWLLVVLALATPVGLLLYSVTVTDLWLARGLYASAPAAALVLAALLVRIPRPLNVVAIVVVLGTLAFATIRAASPSWTRPPARAVAGYLDRIAPAKDPVTIQSFVGESAINAMFHDHHHLVAPQELAANTPPGAEAFYVRDTTTERVFRLEATPVAPRGLVLVGHRHFPSAIFGLDVTIYRRPSG